MKAFVACAMGLHLLSAQAILAQTEEQPPAEPAPQQIAAPQFTVQQLLSRGFDIKAMAYTNGAIVLILQGGIDAFVCETDGMGNSRACVVLK